VDDDLLVELAAQGNLELARERLRELNAGPRETADLLRRLNHATSPVGTVFAPLPPAMGETGGLSCAVRVELGRGHSERLGPAARRAADDAIAEAWRIIAGPGAAPAAGVVLELCDRLGREVEGSSLFLPALLAAVRCFSHMQLHQSVMATGSFDEPLGSLPQKLGLFGDRERRLGLDSLLVASKGPVDFDGALQCPDGEDAVRRVFGFVPWHRDAEVRRVHAYCPPRKEVPWPAGSYVPVELPETLGPGNLTEAAARIRSALGDAERVELSIGGPVAFAAKVGHDLKNLRTVDIVVVHEGERWLSNKTTWAQPPQPATAPSGNVRLVLTTKGRGAEGWEMHEVSDPMRPSDLAAEIAWLLETAATVSSLDLAVDGPYPLAWAAVQALKNHKAIRFFHFEKSTGTYHLWFEG
jgi:hypothetical protein